MATVSGLTGNVPAAKKSKSWLLYIILLLVLGAIVFGVYSFVKARGTQEDTDTGGGVRIVDLDDEEEEETPEEPAEEETDEEETDSTDFSNYSTDQQSIGTSTNESEYTLSQITDTSETGFHQFVFEVAAKGGATDTPNVIATYSSTLGSIRMDLNGVTTDDSGIGYQKSRSINMEGVIRLYHNVSANQSEELYDIGVVSSTPFYLYVTETETGMWDVILEVKYPGASTAETDFGSSEFSKNPQEIDGAVKADGAKVSAYSYTTSSGILSIVFTVSGSTAKPIPSATAGYDGDLLTLRFTSVTKDVIATMPAALDLPGGITMVWQMEDSDTSIYTFEGADGEYRLSGTTNPNQVVLEIKL